MIYCWAENLHLGILFYTYNYAFPPPTWKNVINNLSIRLDVKMVFPKYLYSFYKVIYTNW